MISQGWFIKTHVFVDVHFGLNSIATSSSNVTFFPVIVFSCGVDHVTEIISLQSCRFYADTCTCSYFFLASHHSEYRFPHCLLVEQIPHGDILSEAALTFQLHFSCHVMMWCRPQNTLRAGRGPEI